jgi:hypothetical protein
MTQIDARSSAHSDPSGLRGPHLKPDGWWGVSPGERQRQRSRRGVSINERRALRDP